MKTIVASFSGGRSSAYMCYLLEQHPAFREIPKVYVFANTGREMPDTLIFVRDVQRDLGIKVHLIEAKVNHDERKSTGHRIVEHYMDLSLDGEPFEEVIKKYGLPSVSFPHCSRELKINPIRSFCSSMGLTKENAVQAIGIRFDEARRIKNDATLFYPLFSLGIKKEDVNEFWSRPEMRHIRLPLEDFEGNCDFCFKKSWGKLQKMYAKHPTRALWWNDMENKYYEEGAEIYRGHKVILDLANGVDHNEQDINCACGKDTDNFF